MVVEKAAAFKGSDTQMTATLEGTELRRTLLGVPSLWLRRVFAAAIDLAIVAIAAIVLLIASRAIFGQYDKGLAYKIVIVDIVALIYYPLFMLRTNGETIGKRLLGIRVARTDGLAMTLCRSIWREVIIKIGILDLLILIPVVGFAVSEVYFIVDVLWPLWDSRERALHDIFAGTYVLRIDD